MVEQLPNSSAGLYERDGLPIRVFHPELDEIVDETARKIADAGEDGIDEAFELREGLARDAFRYRVLAARTGRQEFGELADSYKFLYDVAWETIERAKEMLVAEGRDWGARLRELSAEAREKNPDASGNQGI